MVMNLWCRKALSTRYLKMWRCRSARDESLMPKGVEHTNILILLTAIAACVESLMPKGVEHGHPFVPDNFQFGVESLMPKGVEHHWVIASFALREYCWISDAERRWAHEGSRPCFVMDSFWISDAERRWAHVQRAEQLVAKQVLNLWCRKALSTAFTVCKMTVCKLFWISDAERRWAHEYKAMISKKLRRMLNLWCRKALSTYIQAEAVCLEPVLNLWCRKAL